MVINGLLQLLMLFLRVLFTPLKILAIPAEIGALLADIIIWLVKGAGVVAYYTHFPFIMACVTFCCAVEALYFGYKVVMWILRKLPFLGID